MELGVVSLVFAVATAGCGPGQNVGDTSDGTSSGDVADTSADAGDTSQSDTTSDAGDISEGDSAEDGGDGGMVQPPATNCGEVDRTADADPPPTGDEEITLSGTYRISSKTTYNDGQRVTIEPGTVFLMESDALIRTGWNGNPATILAEGTAEKPILFCGTKGAPGHWQGLSILGGTKSESTFQHIRIEDAGANDSSAFNLQVEATVESATITNNAATGMTLYTLAEDSTEFTVTGNEGVPLDLKGADAVTHLPSGDYTGNGTDVALVGALASSETIVRDIGIPYRQDAERFRFGGANVDKQKLTFEAGVEYQFCQDCWITMGWSAHQAALQVKGEADNPVVFTTHRGDEANPGDWEGIYIDSGTTSETEIDHAEFHYGGKSEYGNLVIRGGDVRVSNSLFKDSAGAGIRIKSEGSVLDLSNNTFENNAKGDIVRDN